MIMEAVVVVVLLFGGLLAIRWCVDFYQSKRSELNSKIPTIEGVLVAGGHDEDVC